MPLPMVGVIYGAGLKIGFRFENHCITILNSHVYGLVAQLGERRVRNAEVMGSNPTRSTSGKLPLPMIG